MTSRYEEKKARVEERKYLEGCCPPQEPFTDISESHIAQNTSYKREVEHYGGDSSLIQLSNKYLLSPYCAPATFLGTVDTQMRKTGNNF